MSSGARGRFDVRAEIGLTVSPERADLVLAPHVPNSKLDALVLHGLHVESYSWDRVNILGQLEVVYSSSVLQWSRLSRQSMSELRTVTSSTVQVYVPLTQNGRFPGCIQPDHKDSLLQLAKPG